jgi:hypothetical protein
MMMLSDFADGFKATSTRFQLAVIVAQYAEVLRNSYWAKEAGTSLVNIAEEAERLATLLSRDTDVKEFAELTARSIELTATQ